MDLAFSSDMLVGLFQNLILIVCGGVNAKSRRNYARANAVWSDEREGYGGQKIKVGDFTKLEFPDFCKVDIFLYL